jgi:hypothetical protein
MKVNHGFGLLTVLFLAAPGAAQAAECVDCHEEVAGGAALKDSPHAKLGEGKAGGSCVACHGEFEFNDDGHAKPPKADCVKCHQAVEARMSVSVHGVANEDAPKCVDCHGTHDVVKKGANHGRNLRIAAKCGACHDKEFTIYKDSWHGKAPNDKVATCTDCHGDHDVLPPIDPHSTVFRLNQAQSCAKCHMDEERGFQPAMVSAVKDYFGSVHGLAVTKAGLMVSATCIDCHGSHDVTHGNDRGDNRISRAKIPATCGKCHAGVVNLYLESVHGKPFLDGNLDVPVCTDCHRTHQIESHLKSGASTYATNVAETCLKCHSQASVVNKYGMPEARVQTYQESFHGASSKLGDTRVANCASCHEAHDIRASSDPKSSTNAANTSKTCGKCHSVEDVNKPITTGKIHSSLAEDRHWLTALVEKLYIALVSVTMTFFLSYIIADIVRTNRKRKGGGGH